MSRQPSTKKYQIGNPTLVSSTRAFGGNDGPYPSFPPATSGPSGPSTPSYTLDSPIPGPSNPNGSPSRPVRSRLRDAPAIPVSEPARPERRQLQPLQTRDLRRQSPERDRERDRDDLSPITTTSPIGQSLAFSDPFAADKAQRSQLREHASQAQQASASAHLAPSKGTEKLRNVVGAFMAASKKDKDDGSGPGLGLKRPQRSEARGRIPKREDTWDIEPTGQGGDIDTVLAKIKKDWPFVLESDFSPSTLALSLLSQSTSTPSVSSLPAHPSLGSFNHLHSNLSSALQSAVQAHFQTFAASLPQHASFLTTLGRAQEQVKQSKKELNEARDGFAGKGKGELAGVRARERQVRDMLKVLDTIDHLRSVPDRLETLIGDKKFIEASVLLVRSIKTSRRSDIAEIGAMSDLTAYFASQENTLADILTEELHSHIYLKTFYSESRWSAYSPASPHLTRDARFDQYIENLAIKPSQDPMLEYLDGALSSVPVPTTTLNPPKVNRPAGSDMPQAGSTASLASIANTNPDHHTADTGNPEADSYAYIENVLEALAVLGRLGTALQKLAQGVSGEVHALIDATLDEVEERIEQRRNEAQDEQAHTGLGTGLASGQTATTTLIVGSSPQHAAILRDLFWTLYSKLAAVLEGHRITYEVSRWISSRREFRDATLKGSSTLNPPVLEIYKPIQSAVRTLLRSYLSDDTRSSLDARPLMSLNEIIRDGKIARDRQKSLFKFSDTDTRALDVKDMTNSLQAALSTSVPGLLQNDATAATGTSSASAQAEEAEDANHRTLIPPNVFNVSTLFSPTVSFIQRVSEIVPPGFETEVSVSAFGSVLEDFVVRVFLPQLDEKVTASFQQAVSGYDAHQIDRKLGASVQRPPLKSSVRVMGLIHGLCNMLATTPFHRENYSRLIVGVIVQYYQQCSARFKDIASLSTTGQPLSLPAAWSQREDVIELAKEIQAIVPSDQHELQLISQREIKLEMDLLQDRAIVEAELIASPRKLEALAQLAESLRWFIDSLLDIEAEADEVVKESAGPKLPLTQAMSQRFDAIIQTYEQLAEMVLNTYRLEVRGRVICNLGASMRSGDYMLESEALELDPDILDLNASIKQSEEIACQSLADEDRIFVLRGLSHLVEHVMVSYGRYIKSINSAGVDKIKRNILSIQQCLRGLPGTNGQGVASGNNVLSKAMAYWDLYQAGPKQMLEDLRHGKPMFTFDEYNTMLNLQCKTGGPKEAPSSELNTYLIDLHALSMSIEGWEIGEI